jgi:hypothetical protein
MPKWRAEHAKIEPVDYQHAGSSVGDLRNRFLFFIRCDTPQVMEALLALDGSDSGLLAWAKDWHLQDEWIRDVARRTLDDWRTHPALATELHWASAIHLNRQPSAGYPPSRAPRSFCIGLGTSTCLTCDAGRTRSVLSARHRDSRSIETLARSWSTTSRGTTWTRSPTSFSAAPTRKISRGKPSRASVM